MLRISFNFIFHSNRVCLIYCINCLLHCKIGNKYNNSVRLTCMTSFYIYGRNIFVRVLL